MKSASSLPITDFQKEFLRVLLVSDQEFSPVWRQWKKQAGNYQKLDESISRLFPYLYRRLKRLKPHDSWLTMLKNVHRASWLKNQLLFTQLGEVEEMFKSKKLPFLLTKGGVYGRLYYDDHIADRRMEDLDVWVPASKFFTTLKELQKLGWEIIDGNNVQVFQTDFFHAISLRKGKSKIDLHSHLLHFYLQNDDWKHAKGQTQDIVINHQHFKTLSDTYHLVHACLNGLHATSSLNLQWVIDAALIIKKENVVWSEVVKFARHFQAGLPLALAFTYLRAEFQVPIPLTTIQELEKTPIDFSYQRLYQLHIRDTTNSLFPTLESHWWVYWNSFRNGSSKARSGQRFIQYLSFLCQTDQALLLITRLITLTKNLLVRSVSRSPA